jgi:hypothetical protein
MLGLFCVGGWFSNFPITKLPVYSIRLALPSRSSQDLKDFEVHP